MMKCIIVFFAIATISCQTNKLFDLNEMAEQGTLHSFMSAQNLRAGAPVTVTTCLDNAPFHITKMAVNPQEIIKGGSIKIKVGGIMLTEQTVNKIHLDTYYNGAVIYTQDVDKANSLVKKGPWAFDYEASVPTFTPQGSWEIFVFLINQAQEKIACVKANFVMP